MVPKNTKWLPKWEIKGHSEANYFQFKAWKEAGIIKDVTQHDGPYERSQKVARLGVPISSPSRINNPFPTPWTGIPGTPLLMSMPITRTWVNGQWRCWYDFGMGALGDWGAHIMDTAHEFLDLGLRKKSFLPDLMVTTPSFSPWKLPSNLNSPKGRYAGHDHYLGMTGKITSLRYRRLRCIRNWTQNIPPPSDGQLQPSRLNPGKIIYGKDLTFKGGSHGSTLSIIPERNG